MTARIPRPSIALNPRRRDLRPETLALIQPVLTKHSITPEQWEARSGSAACIQARTDAAALLFERGWKKAAIARALGVDDRMVYTYLDNAGVPNHSRPYHRPIKEKGGKRPLPLVPQHRLLVGEGERHDCLRNNVCVDEVLMAYKHGEEPQRLHCPARCPDLLRPSRESAIRDSLMNRNREALS